MQLLLMAGVSCMHFKDWLCCVSFNDTCRLSFALRRFLALHNKRHVHTVPTMLQLRVLVYIASVAYGTVLDNKTGHCSVHQKCTFLHTGKSAERPILSEDNIEHNVQSIQALLQRLLSQKGEQGIPEPVLLNNLDWFGTMPLLTFLRQV